MTLTEEQLQEVQRQMVPTELFDCVERGDIEETIRSIKQGEDVNARNWTGQTPLYVAAADGKVEICEILIENGAEVNTGTIDPYIRPLWTAAVSGDWELCELLIDNGAEINLGKECPLELKPLYAAASRGHVEVQRLLIERGARIV